MMSAGINIANNTEYTLKIFTDVLNQGARTVRFVSSAPNAKVYLKQTNAQGFVLVGETVTGELAIVGSLHPQDTFKVVFASGTVTASVVN